MDNELIITRRRLPHWQLPGSTYYVTFRVARGELSKEERRIVLDHIKSGDKRFYHLIAAIVMPDHTNRILGDAAELEEKLNYMLMNSVMAGLVDNAWEAFCLANG